MLQDIMSSAAELQAGRGGSPDVHVRLERPGDLRDAAAVRAVQRAAFPTSAEAELLDALQSVGAYDPASSLLAEHTGPSEAQVVGHCLLSAATLVRADGSTRTGRIAALGPIAVLPAWQKRGIGAALMHAALRHADQAGLAAIVLLGHPAYYPRFGFRPARAQGLLPPDDWPDAAWMACRLSGWTQEDTGTVHYASPFMTMGRASH